MWLSTKVGARDGEGAKEQIERSLKRLQTDHLDELKIHSIQSLEDVEEIVKKGNVFSVIQKLKEEGVTRHIGFSGHASAEAMVKLAKEFEFDTMLIAMNHYHGGGQPFEKTAIPTAADKGLGVLVMKVIRPRETVEEVTVEDLIQYALSLKHVNCAIIGWLKAGGRLCRIVSNNRSHLTIVIVSGVQPADQLSLPVVRYLFIA